MSLVTIYSNFDAKIEIDVYYTYDKNKVKLDTDSIRDEFENTLREIEEDVLEMNKDGMYERST
tara:strand:+ start:2698 stop:2886 length:189 start_codon:yes stop_codon:yes gene_type:complete